MMRVPAGGVPQVGEMIAGKYRMLRVIGRGGVGMVVAAEHVALRQLVAVKLLLPDALARMPDATSRLLREAQAAASIQSERVARTLDVGVLANGLPYVVMEHLVGTDLGGLLRARGALPTHEAVDYVLQTCEAIAEAHAIGIIHRDLKPSNVFIIQRPGVPPSAKVLDFGLATAAPTGAMAGHDANLTGTGVVMGSIHYMPPEQLRELRRADARSDIWSIGVILYELVAGRRPFEGATTTESMMMIGTDAPPRLPPHVPPELAAVIGRCLEKAPDRRPQSVGELARMLGPFATDFGRASVQRAVACSSGMITGPTIPAASRPITSPNPPQLDTQAGVGATRPVAARPRGRVALWVVLAAVMMASGGVAAAWSQGLLRRLRPATIDADRLASFAPLPAAPREPGDAAAKARVALGKKLFADPRIAKNGDIACTTCHPLDRYGTDGRRLSRGSDDQEPPRNTPGIYNVSGYFALLWDGRHTKLEDQAKEVLTSPRAMAATPELLHDKLASIPEYDPLFGAAFPGEDEAASFDHAAAALAAYESTLFMRGRWDRFLEGDARALSEDEKRGFDRFVDVGCVTCHFGPNVGATMFQKVGLVKAWPDTKDRGRYEITKRDEDLMVFRVPSLRNVDQTAPYFHNGSVPSLDVAIRMMAHHQLGKEISEDDVSAIHAWLATLTGDPTTPPPPR